MVVIRVSGIGCRGIGLRLVSRAGLAKKDFYVSGSRAGKGTKNCAGE